MQIKIGIDFDNTIVCYDEPLRFVAKRENIVIPGGNNIKEIVKNYYMRLENGNLMWSQLQGELYGKLIEKAKPFEGLINFLKTLTKKKIPFCIISHKSLHPAVGETFNFHQAAVGWLCAQGLLGNENINLTEDNCFWEMTKQLKLERIKVEGCTHFIDDLSSILADEDFPSDVQGILFGEQPSGSLPLTSWHDAWSRISQCKSSSLVCQLQLSNDYKMDSLNSFKKLLKKCFDQDVVRFEAILGGGNNKIYKITTENDQVFMGKNYYPSLEKKNERLWRETQFLKLLNIDDDIHVPHLYVFDHDAEVAIYEYVEGSSWMKGSVDVLDDHWRQALDFLLKIQKLKVSAKELPRAAESAFSLADHLGHLHARRDNWLYTAQQNVLDQELKELILVDLENAYRKLAEKLIIHKDFKRMIPIEGRILSPSDFGLHNALLDGSGNAVFFDFEYSGWDDPAKTVADFFCQQCVPAPLDFYSIMCDALASILPVEEFAFFAERLPWVQECIRLKWCYIILNSAHPVHGKRRDFAGCSSASGEMLIRQVKELLYKDFSESFRVNV